MGLYHPLGDFATNNRLIYDNMLAAYAEDYANYENGFKPVKMRNTKSRNAAKRSARRTSAAKKMHLVERDCVFDSKKRAKETLIIALKNQSIDGLESMYAETNIGYFLIQFSHKKLLWRAEWEGKKFAYEKSPFAALAKLLSGVWGKDGDGKTLSMYNLYRTIVFDVGQKPNVRNRTRVIKAPLGYQMLWQDERIASITLGVAYVPPPSPRKKASINMMTLTGEKSLL